MNLHIVPDNIFINAFYDNLEALGLLGENKIVVRTNKGNLTAIKRDIPFGQLYTSRFDDLVGDTLQYRKVFIHYFTPLLYRWVALHQFKELNWMVWGGDLYNLPALDSLCYAPITRQLYTDKNRSIRKMLYQAKVWAFHARFKKAAYGKVKNILTWMREEYAFAMKHLPVKAQHQFFFYENQLPYAKLDGMRQTSERSSVTLVIGNSGTPSNNHLDTLHFLEKHQVHAELVVPVSYGDAHYISFLKKNLTFRYGNLTFVEQYMPFEEYIRFLSDSDALVMNTIRPQGYGNIFMMQYLNKPVFFSEKNISLPDLADAGVSYGLLADLGAGFKKGTAVENKDAVAAVLSHERLLRVYKNLFTCDSDDSV